MEQKSSDPLDPAIWHDDGRILLRWSVNVKPNIVPPHFVKCNIWFIDDDPDSLILDSSFENELLEYLTNKVKSRVCLTVYHDYRYSFSELKTRIHGVYIEDPEEALLFNLVFS